MEQIETTAIAALNICNNHGATFIINDHVELAKKINAHGVHLGKKDMLPSKARKILGQDFIIGGTANTLDDMLWCTQEGCDYIGVGPYRFTTTKEQLAPIIGDCNMIDLMEAYNIKVQNPLPLIAVGGITSKDVADLLKTGCHGVAVSGAITQVSDPRTATKELITELNHEAVTYC